MRSTSTERCSQNQHDFFIEMIIIFKSVVLIKTFCGILFEIKTMICSLGHCDKEKGDWHNICTYVYNQQLARCSN